MQNLNKYILQHTKDDVIKKDINNLKELIASAELHKINSISKIIRNLVQKLNIPNGISIECDIIPTAIKITLYHNNCGTIFTRVKVINTIVIDYSNTNIDWELGDIKLNPNVIIDSITASTEMQYNDRLYLQMATYIVSQLYNTESGSLFASYNSMIKESLNYEHNIIQLGIYIQNSVNLLKNNFVNSNVSIMHEYIENNNVLKCGKKVLYGAFSDDILNALSYVRLKGFKSKQYVETFDFKKYSKVHVELYNREDTIIDVYHAHSYEELLSILLSLNINIQ